MFRKVKRAVHCFLLNLIDLIAPCKTIVKEAHLAVIRLDAIGDYILFRNFLNELKASAQYQDYNITLIGNDAWRDLAETFDADDVDNFIFINRNKFYKNYYYRFMMLRQLSSIGFETVINPMYSREFYLSESIVNALTAKEKIACDGDFSNISSSDKKKADSFYTKLLLSKKDILFEFYRNQEFFEHLLSKSLSTNLAINMGKLSVLTEVLPDYFIVLFLGASRLYRKWSPKKFADVAIFLKEKYHYEIVVCGAHSDIEHAQLFKKHFKGDYIDMVGKTTLLELMSVIQKCQFLISNETSAVHFAVALGVGKVFVLYNGNHFGRFTPYPELLCQGYKLICHPEIEKNKRKYQDNSNEPTYINQLDINDITVNEVIRAIENS